MSHYLLAEGGEHLHRVLAAKALGRALPRGVEIHHLDGDKKNNASNLVLCQDHSYHALLHVRTKAKKACGDPRKRRCSYCREWDDPGSMTCRASRLHGNEYRHKACHTAYERKRTERIAGSSAGRVE